MNDTVNKRTKSFADNSCIYSDTLIYLFPKIVKYWGRIDHFCVLWYAPGVLSTNINFNLCKESFCKLCVILTLFILHGAFPQRNFFYLYFLPQLQFISDWHADKSIQFLYIIVQPLIISTYFSSVVFLFR